MRAATPNSKKKSSVSVEGSEPVDLQVQHVLETSNKSHVQALLKLRQYKKNLKYAIWDYQGGMLDGFSIVVGLRTQNSYSRKHAKDDYHFPLSFQDGKPISEAARRYRLPTSVVQYSVDLILRETGQSLDDLLENKDQV